MCYTSISKSYSHLQQSMGRKQRLSVHQKNEERKKVKRAKLCDCTTQRQVSEPDHDTTMFTPPPSPGMYEYYVYIINFDVHAAVYICMYNKNYSIK